jgi:hypothetical protein
VLNLVLHSVHMHIKVCTVCIHIILACVLCTVLAERKVLVCGGGVLNFGMVQRIE